MTGPPDRYEPMPDIAGLPGWLWRKLSRPARIALVVALLAGAGGAVAIAPQIRDANRERTDADRRERAEARERRARALQTEQRPRSGRSSAVAPAGAGRERRLALRGRLMADVVDAIAADARRRTRSGELDGRVRRVTCEPFPRSIGRRPPEADLSRRRGRYACVAVTSEFGGGVIGHPYRALVDFGSGRYAYCKIAGVPGPARDRLATTPRACGGR